MQKLPEWQPGKAFFPMRFERHSHKGPARLWSRIAVLYVTFLATLLTVVAIAIHYRNVAEEQRQRAFVLAVQCDVPRIVAPKGQRR